MASPAVFVPIALGCVFLIAGICTYRRDVLAPASRSHSRIFALAPVFIAGSLAAFAGEHFTAARSLAQLVPKGCRRGYSLHISSVGRTPLPP
jgi:hypothetical protein